MSQGINTNLYYPQISSLNKSNVAEKIPHTENFENSDFSKLLKDNLNIKEPLKFSAHALQRIAERKLNMDEVFLTKLNEAIDKADAKGVMDTLVITDDAALIVSVKNRTVVTAMDRNALNGNVFTNIDGAIVV